MSKELVISANRHETKVALIDDDQLVEVYFQRSNEYSLAGSIHKGRVTRVLPGMQSAFVDLGLERDTFLYVSDFLEDHEDFDKITGDERSPAQRGGGGGGSRDRDRDRGGRPPRQDRGFRTEQPVEGSPPTSASTSSTAAPSVSTENGDAFVAQTEAGSEAAASTAEEPVEQNELQTANVVPGSVTPEKDTEKDKQEHERHGRRSRRRRRGSRGFPDSKYAAEGGTPADRPNSPSRENAKSNGLAEESSTAQTTPDARSAKPAGGYSERHSEHHSGQHSEQRSYRHDTGDQRSAGHQGDNQADNQSEPVNPGHIAPIMLPGESLAKYRNAPPQTAAPVASKPVDEPAFSEEAENEFAESVHYLPENALPDAPVHHPEVLTAQVTAAPHREALIAKETASDIVKETQEIAPSVFAPSPFPTEEFFAAVPLTEVPAAQEASAHAVSEATITIIETESIETESVETDDSETDEAETTHDANREFARGRDGVLDDDEDSDIQAMILGDLEGIEISESESSEGGGETAAGSAESSAAESTTSESGTAAVRERGGRYPHRVSRRRRRGGRGGSSEAGYSDPNRNDANRSEPSADAGASDQKSLAGASPAATTSLEARAEGSREPNRENRGEHRDRNENRSDGRHERSGSRPNNAQPLISDLLKEGQEIIVQIAKEPLGQKGARITSHIALPGRYVVYMPTLEHMGVSRKIESDEERLRLKRALQAKRPGPVGGFITRTAAEGRSEDEIAGDMQFLYNLWNDIKTKADKGPAPKMLHHDLDIVQRILRDQLADNFKAIWIDNEEHYESVLRFVETFQPALVPKVKLYTREAPIFDAFGVTAELEKALRPKVWLKSGGFIVINQTEALVAIDVNTGKYVGKTNRLEDTIVKTNTEAIKEIVRQIRLRDLGGIIVIDFIDMDERKNRAKVMQVLEEAMRVDRAPYKILQFNDFGLVAITRKRVKQSLERTLCSPCPHCEGAGYVKSVQTVVSEILTEARKMSKHVEGKDVMLRVHPEVAKVLKSQQNKFLEELEEVLKRPVLVKSDPLLHHEKFDLG